MDITRIPGLMRRCHGWVVAPALMDEWFRRFASQRSPNTTIVTMDWALRYERARNVYQQMVSTHAWRDADAQRRIMRWLASQNRLTANPETFGPARWNPPDPTELENDAIGSRAVGNLAGDPLDDLYGALGRFDFRMVVAGTVHPAGPSALPAPTMSRSPHPQPLPNYEVRISRIGIYLWDTFDFDSHQILGYWGDRGMTVSQWGELVTNGDFRSYRQRTGHGGDFLIYSDVRTIQGDATDTFVAAI